MCNRDCFNCPYPDCTEEGVTEAEIQASAGRDLEALQGRKQADKRAYMKAYHEAHKEEEKARQRRKYATDPEYRERKKAMTRKACAAYYWRHREEILAQKRAKAAERRAALEYTRGKREARA